MKERIKKFLFRMKLIQIRKIVLDQIKENKKNNFFGTQLELVPMKGKFIAYTDEELAEEAFVLLSKVALKLRKYKVRSVILPASVNGFYHIKDTSFADLIMEDMISDLAKTSNRELLEKYVLKRGYVLVMEWD